MPARLLSRVLGGGGGGGAHAARSSHVCGSEPNRNLGLLVPNEADNMTTIPERCALPRKAGGESLVCLPWGGGSGVPSPGKFMGEFGVSPLETRVWCILSSECYSL